MNYERAQNDFVGLYAPNLIYHSIFTPPIKMEPTFIQNPNSSSDDSFNDDTSNAMVGSPCPSTYTTLVRLLTIGLYYLIDQLLFTFHINLRKYIFSDFIFLSIFLGAFWTEIFRTKCNIAH